jgi:hypothetical protein
MIGDVNELDGASEAAGDVAAVGIRDAVTVGLQQSV